MHCRKPASRPGIKDRTEADDPQAIPKELVGRISLKPRSTVITELAVIVQSLGRRKLDVREIGDEGLGHLPRCTTEAPPGKTAGASGWHGSNRAGRQVAGQQRNDASKVTVRVAPMSLGGTGVKMSLCNMFLKGPARLEQKNA